MHATEPGGFLAPGRAGWPFLVFALFSALAAVHLYPVISCLFTHAFGPGMNGDTSLYYWDQWYIGKVLRGGAPLFESFLSGSKKTRQTPWL